MTRWVQTLLLVVLLSSVAGCARAPGVDGIGHHIPTDDAVRIAKEESPLIEVTSTETYTAPPTVHVIRGTDKEGKQLIVWVYTSVIRHVYADKLITVQQARDIAEEAGFPVKAVRESSLRAAVGTLEGRTNPVLWSLDTKAGWIWIDAETGTILRRLDAE